MEGLNCTTNYSGNTSIQTVINVLPKILPGITKELIEAYNVFLYIIIALGIPGNLLVLLVFAKHRPSITTDWFILFITACDFLSSLFSVPVYVTFTNTMWIYYGTNIICKLHMFFSQSIVFSSSFLICGLAIDIYLKVCRPHSNILNVNRARNGCVATTLVTSILSIPSIFMYDNIAGHCVVVAMGNELILYYLMVFPVFCISTIAVVVSYSKVVKALRISENKLIRHPLEIGKQQRIQNNNSCKRHFDWMCACMCTRCNKIYPSGTNVTDSYEIHNDSYELHNTTTKAYTSFHLSEKTPTSHLTVHSAANGERYVRSRAALPAQTSLQTTSTSFAFDTNTQASSSHGQQVQSQIMPRGILRKSKRTTTIAFIVCAVFVISWLPPWIVFFIALNPAFREIPTVVRFMFFGKMTYLLNTVANPVVYMSFNSKFRQQIRGLLKCSLKLPMFVYDKSSF